MVGDRGGDGPGRPHLRDGFLAAADTALCALACGDGAGEADVTAAAHTFGHRVGGFSQCSVCGDQWPCRDALIAENERQTEVIVKYRARVVAAVEERDAARAERDDWRKAAEEVSEHHRAATEQIAGGTDRILAAEGRLEAATDALRAIAEYEDSHGGPPPEVEMQSIARAVLVGGDAADE